MATSSDAGFMMSDAPSRPTATTPKQQNRPFHPSSSSARPRGPPSENLGAPSDDEGEGFADDQIPRRSRPTASQNITPVEDRIGLLIQEHFESFIEG